MKLPLTLIASFLFFSNCYAADLKISQGTFERVLSDKDFQQLHLSRLEIEDPVYKKHKKYEGYWLSEIFDAVGIHPDPKTVWVFTALDGYKARISVAEVIKSRAKAFVAVKDLGAQEGWEKIQQGKESVSPGPYYLVWQIPANTPAGIKLPWPYQMAEISILADNEAQENIFPDDDHKSASVVRGFKVFQQNCIACHSINLEGGTIGPELNIPKNILEYQDRKFLKEFISNPGSFQAKNKMPGFNESLPDQSIEDVLDYLAWMGKHKINGGQP